jgi:ABC-2 type transport system ATP-binding protein
MISPAARDAPGPGKPGALADLSPSIKAVSVKGLRYDYPPAGRAAAGRTALDGLDLDVQAGEIFGLLGPNGSGKTNLFRILSTRLPPTAGQAEIFGLDTARNAAQVRHKIGVVFQHPSLDKKLTVAENLVHQGHLYGLRGRALSGRVEEVLERFKVASRARDRVEHLSGGLHRRVEVAKGLLHRPALLLMDEPSTGLDPGARHDLWSYLLDLRREGMTILLTTHLMEEGEPCDRLAILHHGRAVALGTPAQLKSEIGGDMVIIRSSQPAALAEEIQKRFSVRPQVLDQSVRLEKEQGHTLIAPLVESFPDLVASVTVGKPTLEDVFIHHTGEQFLATDASEGQP